MNFSKKQILLKVKNTIKEKYPQTDIYLYGSRARGDNKRNSDWDFLILLNEDNFINIQEDKIRESVYEIELQTNQILSLLIYSKKYWNEKLYITPLYGNIKKEGILL